LGLSQTRAAAQHAKPRETLLVGETKVLFDGHHWNDRMPTAILRD
jgi:hypothetical protein